MAGGHSQSSRLEGAVSPGEEEPEAGGRGAGGSSSPGEKVVALRPANPEVEGRAKRRRFEKSYKLRILEEAELCVSPREIGALLRREGLYSSHLTKWRQERERGGLKSLEPTKRGPKPNAALPLHRKVRDLERDNERLRRKLRQAETIIDIQKKVSEILGISLAQIDSDGEES